MATNRYFIFSFYTRVIPDPFRWLPRTLFWRY
jgi:hypothetical protein